MIGQERAIEATQALVPEGTITQVAFVLPEGAIGKQVGATLAGTALGAATGGTRGAELGSALGQTGMRLGQDLFEDYPAFCLALSDTKLYLFGMRNQGILHRMKGVKLLESWSRSDIEVSDKQVGISHHVTISPMDGGQPLTLEAKVFNSGLPELLQTLGSVHQS